MHAASLANLFVIAHNYFRSFSTEANIRWNRYEIFCQSLKAVRATLGDLEPDD